MNRKKALSVIPPPAPPEPKQPHGGLRLEEASAYSGMTVCYLRAKIADNTLIPARAGKRFLLTRAQLDAHLADLQQLERLRRGVA
jgi:hypothetical protein